VDLGAVALGRIPHQPHTPLAGAEEART
jgi:hypothetical protein